MTTVTITIDDPNGSNSDLIFPSAFLNKILFTTPSSIGFNPIVGGLADFSTFYTLTVGGDCLVNPPSPYGSDVSGFVNSLLLTRKISNGPQVQLMHASFALDGTWAGTGGVYLPSVVSLTADVLAGRVIQGSTFNLELV